MITVIIPTLWNIPRLYKTLEELNDCKYVGEIILIDNTENKKRIRLNKLNHILEGKNTYVTAAWNKGVQLSKYNKILILNDDTWFKWDLISEIEKFIEPSVGMIGIGRENYFSQSNEPVKLECINKRPNAYACAFFVHKNSWVQIPKDIKIWFNDDWLFITNNRAGKKNYRLWNFKVEGQISQTMGKLMKNEKIQQIIKNDKKVFTELGMVKPS